MLAAKEWVELLLIGLLQGGAHAGNMVKANLLLFLELGSKKGDENLHSWCKDSGRECRN